MLARVSASAAAALSAPLVLLDGSPDWHGVLCELRSDDGTMIQMCVWPVCDARRRGSSIGRVRLWLLLLVARLRLYARSCAALSEQPEQPTSQYGVRLYVYSHVRMACACRVLVYVCACVELVLAHLHLCVHARVYMQT